MNQRAPMGKTERQRLIQTVVQQREVATQRELVSALSALGCEVTQATVSPLYLSVTPRSKLGATGREAT